MTKAEKTRQFIIEKTAPIFNKKGYAGTSLNDMTTATGLTKGSIYGNFANKDEVAVAAFDHNVKLVQSIIRHDVEKQTSYKHKLLVHINVYDGFSKNFPEGGCPVLNTAVEADDTHPLLKKKATEAINAWKSQIAKIIEQGIANKEFKSTVNADQTAITIIAMIEGAIMISKLTGKSQYKKAILSSVENLIENLT